MKKAVYFATILQIYSILTFKFKKEVFSMILGYIRVSSGKQYADNQKHALLEWAQQNKIVIDEFIEVEASTKKSEADRKINEVIDVLSNGDELVVTELSRLGRNMLDVLNLINELETQNISIIFVKQPELSTGNRNPQSKLIRAIFGYFAEAERDFISQRTKQGLEAAKAKGKKLGRPKGAKAKEKKLDEHRSSILEYLNMGLSTGAIHKIVSAKTEVSYNTVKAYIASDKELKRAQDNYKKGSLIA